jgi:drug/metabolite transporter (DMT)-like permease
LALKFLNLGTAVALRYIAPIYATLFSLFILKEPVEKKQWVYFIVAYAGVLILQGFDSSMSTIGLILIMIGAMFSGLVFMIIRYIKQSENSLVIINYFMGISVIISGVISFFYWTPPLKEHWILLIALGILGFFGQFFMTKSLQMATAIYVSPMKYIEVIFSLILGVSFFEEV